MRPRNRKLLFAVGVAVLITIFIVLNINNIVRHIYHNRYFDGPPMDAKRKGLSLSKTVNFKFSLEDVEFINSFSNTIVPRDNRRRKVELEINGENYPAELSAFNNYFKYIRLNDINRAFSIRFPKKQYHNDIRCYDIFQVDKIDLFEQELIYDLAGKIGLYVPRTEYVDIKIHGVHDGISFFKQAYDNIFLTQNQLPDSIIFIMDKHPQRRGKKDHGWTTTYLYQGQKSRRYRRVIKHLDRFFKLLEAKDPHLLVKYFDTDYIARFEVLRELLGASTGFLMEDNIKFIYNIFNGKFYPILDESNLYNMQTGRKNKHFKLLRKQIKNDPSIKIKKKRYMAELAENYKELFVHFKNLETQYTFRDDESFHNRMRVKLISSYFENNVYNSLKEYKAKSLPQRPTGNVGSGGEFYLDAKSPPGSREYPYDPLSKPREYLDFILLDPHKLDGIYRNLNLEIKKDNRIVLKKGNYTLRETVFIPRGGVLVIQAGTTFKMAPGVSLISYSPIHIWGTKDNPVVVRALKKEKPFGVWAVNGTGETFSIVEYLDFSGGSKTVEAGCVYPGGLNFHETNLELRNSQIHHNRGHDALNAKWGNILLENNRFYSNRTDHAALDFCKGVVIDNQFIDDTSDREGDALDLSGSQFFVSRNVFAQFVDKGLSIGEESKCFLYDNVIRHNRIGAASKNRARVVVMGNKFLDNTKAIAAYQKESMYGGGYVYLFSNDFGHNDQLYKIDKDSLIYTLEDHESYKEKFDRLIENKELDTIFSVIDSLIDEHRYENTGIEAFNIGPWKADVDEKHKVIFAALPHGAATSQTITFKTRLEAAEMFIKPSTRGIRTPDRKTNKESQLFNRQSFDFMDYIFHGKVILKYNFQRSEYDLYVTTGTLPIIEIDTSGEHGIPRVIKNEPKIPCKIRIFSGEKTGDFESKNYTNRLLDGRIEGRGKKMPKWKFGITLEESYPIEGMIDSKHWVLESSFIEKSLMRTKIAFDLLEQFREDKTKRRIAPQSRFVEVMLNGKYHGVYLLMEHINKDFLGLDAFDKNKAFNSVLFRARNENANFSAYNYKSFYKKDYKRFPGRRQPLEKAADPIWGWHSGFEQRYPNTKKHGEIWEPIERFTRFAALAPDSRFSEHIFQYMDRDSYIDLWVFTQLIDDSDGLFKNRYLAKDRGEHSKWYIIPWDKDGIFGRRHDMEKRPYNNQLSTPLFERCMRIPSFRDAFKARWNTLVKKGIISEDNLFEKITQNIALLKDAQKRNFARWPANYYLYPDTHDFYREIEYMKEWIRSRIQWLDKRIGKDDSDE